MKILVVAQHYKPEPFRLSDICEELVKRGHEVTVVTGVPNYPEGYIYKEYKNKKNREEEINGVKIHRSFTIGRRKNTFFRFLNYYSFALSSSINTLRGKYKTKNSGEFDVVLVNETSPVMMCYAGIMYKKKYKKRLIIYCLDLWPESLLVGGVKKNSLLYKYYHKVSKYIYKSADKILVGSSGFRNYLNEEFAIDKKRIEYLPQYAEEIFTPRINIEEKETIDFLFAGNVGVAQGLDIVIEAAQVLKKEDKIYFHIVGDGKELEKLKKDADKLSLNNVIFHGRKPVEEMPRYYNNADAMLVILKDYAGVSLTLPGKVQSYMAAGKPIIASINGEAARVIKKAKCGYVSKAEDTENFVKNILIFSKLTSKEKLELGKNSRKYYEQHFEKKLLIERLEFILKELI